MVTCVGGPIWDELDSESFDCFGNTKNDACAHFGIRKAPPASQATLSQRFIWFTFFSSYASPILLVGIQAL
jgi:hypothetical protein